MTRYVDVAQRRLTMSEKGDPIVEETMVEHFFNTPLRVSDDFQKFIYEHKLTKADIIGTCAYYDGTNAHIVLTYNHRRLKK